MKPYVAALRWPRCTLLAWGAIILVAGYGLKGLELRTDGYALIPQGVPDVQYDAVVRDKFGLHDKIIVVLESKLPGGIFQENTLRVVAELTAEFRKIPGVDPDDVISLATEKSGRIQTGPVQFPNLLDPLPRTEGEVEQARGDATALGIYAGTLLSREKEIVGRTWPYRATAMLIGVPSSADRKQLSVEIRRIARNAVSDDYTLYVVGGPVAESLLGDYILDDLRKLVPATILIMSAIFYWLFRSGRFVLVVIAEIGACLVVTFGAMSHFGVPVTIAMMVLPLVVIPVIVADEVHILTALCRLTQGGARDWMVTLNEAFDANWLPVAKTGVTTALSGVVFAFSSVLAIRDFGIFLSVASLISMLWTLTASPVLLAMRRCDAAQWGRQPSFDAPEALIRWVTRRPGTVIAMILCLPIIPVAIGLNQLTVQDSWTSGFGRNTEFRRSMEKVDAMFDGTQLLYLIFDTRPGALPKTSKPSVLSPHPMLTSLGLGDYFSMRLTNSINVDPQLYVGKRGIVHSVVDGYQPDTDRSRDSSIKQIRAAEVVSASQNGGEVILVLACQPVDRIAGATDRPEQRWSSFVTGERILDPEILTSLAEFETFIETAVGEDGGGLLGAYEQIATARFMLYGRVDTDRLHGDSANENSDLLHLLKAVNGQKRLRETIDAENQQVVITVFLKNANFRDVDALLKKVADYERAHLSPHGIQVGYAGDVLLSQSMIKAITNTELWSIIASLVAMCLLIAVMERSIWIGIICSIPSLLAILANLSIMGMLGIPIGVATSMFAGITFGIGVDSSIHFFERIRISNTFDSRAIAEAVIHVYVAVIAEAIVLVCGFSILMASSVPVNRDLGIFLTSSFVGCSFLTVSLIPALCCVWSKHRTGAVTDGMSPR